MKMSTFLLSSLIAIGAFGGLRADQAKAKTQRIHLKSVSISQVKDGVIYVQTATGPLTLKTLRCDKKGVYFIKTDLVETRDVMTKGWRRHYRNDDNGTVYDCPHCSGRFYESRAYWNHIENQHNGGL